jgi:hypothetical protein
MAQYTKRRTSQANGEAGTKNGFSLFHWKTIEYYVIQPSSIYVFTFTHLFAPKVIM